MQEIGTVNTNVEGVKEKIPFKDWFPYDFTSPAWGLAKMFAMFPLAAAAVTWLAAVYWWDIPNRVPFWEFCGKVIIMLLVWWSVMAVVILIPFFIMFICATFVSKGKPIQEMRKWKLEERDLERREKFANEFRRKNPYFDEEEVLKQLRGQYRNNMNDYIEMRAKEYQGNER